MSLWRAINNTLPVGFSAVGEACKFQQITHTHTRSHTSAFCSDVPLNNVGCAPSCGFSAASKNLLVTALKNIPFPHLFFLFFTYTGFHLWHICETKRVDREKGLSLYFPPLSNHLAYSVVTNATGFTEIADGKGDNSDIKKQ